MSLDNLYSSITTDLSTHTHTNERELTVFSSVKGQSAVEYLMTYGWMLLVVAVVGGAIFSVVQSESVESVSGFSGGDVAIDDFGTTSNGLLQLELRNTAAHSVEINSVNVSSEAGFSEWKGGESISVSETGVVNLANISESPGSGASSLDVTINYDSGGLSNLEVSGTISGSFEINESGSSTEDGGGGGSDPSDFSVVRGSDSGYVNEGEVFEVNYTVENTGSETGSETVELSVDGGVVDTDSVSVDGGETVDGTLEWSTGSGDGGVYDAELGYSGGSESLQAAAAPNDNWAFVDVSEVSSNVVDTSGMSDFFMMQYEASRSDATDSNEGSSGEASSQQGVVPWTQIDQPSARDACQAAGYDLATNKQWQASTMAEIGNSGSWPDGNNGAEGDTGDGTVDPTNSNRVLTGTGPESWSNELGIYDLNGNVWEWTNTTFDQTSSPLYDVSPKDGSGNNHVDSWNPSVAAPGSLSDSGGNSDFGGDHYWSDPNMNDGDTKAVRRGGTWRTGARAGVFFLYLSRAPSHSTTNVGFRCSLS